MTTTTAPDLFTNVHKGIRRALFAAAAALGRAGDDEPRLTAARSLLRQALAFVAHHGDNEDVLLVPLLRERAPDVQARMSDAHATLHEPLAALQAALEHAPAAELYARTCRFLARYLDHMSDEETTFEPRIRAVLDLEQLADFGRQSVARTAPSDQRMMLSFMLPAMARADVDMLLARLPASLASELRPLADDAG